MRYVWLLLLGACSLLTSTDPIPPSGSDAGKPPEGRDAGPPIPGFDAGPPGRRDAGEPVPCEGDPRCAGNVLVECVGGVEERFNCAPGTCGGSPPDCIEACEPGEAFCDGEALVTCDASGALIREPCPFGCDPSASACVPMPSACDDVEDIGSGGHDFDTCEAMNTTSPVAMGDCDAGANGRDRIFRLRLDRGRAVRIQLREDTETPMDTVLYLRTSCDDPASQIQCRDDDTCFTCPGDVDVGESTINTVLEAGEYFIVADTYDYLDGGRRFGCGRVRLDVALF
jgi:hypothetical protein